jgi:hypothetical protein
MTMDEMTIIKVEERRLPATAMTFMKKNMFILLDHKKKNNIF